MYICLCNAVTDQDISDAVRSGAKTFSQVQSQLAVSTGCGRCEPMAQAVLAQTLAGEDALGRRPRNLADLVYAA